MAMRFIPSQLLKRGFNRRAQTFEDFESICAEVGIKYFWSDEESEGMHFIRRGYPIIILSRRLSGFMLLWVAFHELTHCLLHHPGLRYFVRGTGDKVECEAHDISLCCVIPKPALKRVLLSGNVEEFCYPQDMLRERCELLTRSGM